MIRRGREDEAERLREIERDAALLFRASPVPYAADLEVTDAAVFIAAAREGWLLVAGDVAVGFAVMQPLDGEVYLRELDVMRAHQRQGLGLALVEASMSLVRSRGHRALLLTTFREVPWNAPWYRRIGFIDVPAAERGPELLALLAQEKAHGHAMRGRVALRRQA
jgi:GNAT superfamily N-acetyltransferase